MIVSFNKSTFLDRIAFAFLNNGELPRSSCCCFLNDVDLIRSGPEVIKLVSCSTQLSMKVFLLIYVKNANNCWHFNIYEQENSILCLSELEKN